MVSAKALWYGDRKTEKLLETCEEEGPVAFQVFGSDPEVMAFAAEYLDGRENVLLDVNMGCPVPKVVKNGDGSALMRDPDLAGRIVEAMCAKTKKPVTAKIRAGWSHDSVNTVEVARTLESAGAAMVCVHARTREQFYSGKADWDVIARVKAAVGIPVIGNGDVFSREDAERMREQTGCDYVMVARGALGNPWIFTPANQGDANQGDGALDSNNQGDGALDSHANHNQGDGALDSHNQGDANQGDVALDSHANHNQGDGALDSHANQSAGGDSGDGSLRPAGVSPPAAASDETPCAPQSDEAAKRSPEEIAAMFTRHARLTAEDKGEHIAVLEMRKHAGWYFRGIPGAAKLRARVNKATTLAALLAEVEAFTSDKPGAS